MPKFKYKAVGADGRIVKGETEAASEQSVIQNLQQAGSLPIGAWEIKSRNPFRQLLLAMTSWNKTINQNDVALFMSELATLLNSGLPLDHALRTIKNLSHKVPVQSLIQSLLSDVQGGDNLSSAMATHPGVFNRLQINMVVAGEAGGELEHSIKGLADYMERMSELKNSVISALIYPAILLVLSVMSLFVMMTFVVPKFVPLFEDFGQTLPLLTQITFAVADFLQSTWWIILCLCVIVFWYVDKLLSNPENRKRYDAWCLTLPYFGNLIKNIETARFSRTLGTLVQNGVPLLTGVKLVKDIISNQSMAGVISSSIHNLEQGQGLSTTLRDSDLFPSLSVQLIEVGEESGNLDQMLFKVADIYDSEVQRSLKRMLVILEPVLILGMGALIGVIIISILLAMLGLNELI